MRTSANDLKPIVTLLRDLTQCGFSQLACVDHFMIHHHTPHYHRTAANYIEGYIELEQECVQSRRGTNSG